jgi:hypothetical protein
VDNFSANLIAGCASQLVVIREHHHYFKWHFVMTGSKNWETQRNNPFLYKNIQTVVGFCALSNMKVMFVGLAQHPFF